MKHLFYLHSLITEAIATAVVEQQSLNSTDVILICGRGYLPNDRWAGLIEKDPISVPNNPHYLSLIAMAKLVMEFDAWLKQVCNEDFTLYAPQTSIPLISMLVNHPSCKCFNYIEEGLAYYTVPIKKNIPRRLSFRRMWPWYRVRPRCFFEADFKQAYVTRSDCLQQSDKNVIVRPNFLHSNESNGLKKPESKSVAIFVMQTVKWWPVNDACAYFQAIRDELEDCWKRGDQIYYKLHPEQFGADEGSIVKAIMAKFAATELAQNVVLETLSTKEVPLQMITRSSSVVLYLPKNHVQIRFIGKRIADYLPESKNSYIEETKNLERLIDRNMVI